MSRSGYSDECGGWELIRWRGAVASAIRGKRGQAFLRETLAALDTMPVKELAPDSLANVAGQYCTLGAVGARRGIDLSRLEEQERDVIAAALGIPEALAAEVMFENDERERRVYVERHGPPRPGYDTYGLGWDAREANGADRWQRMRKWVAEKIIEPAAGP
jgi:hypothetical protein